MKTGILKILIITILQFQLLFAIDASYRSQASMGALDDDLDKSVGSADILGQGYFPDLADVQSTGLYTNLSNVQQPGLVANRYLLGVAGNVIRVNENLKTAVILETAANSQLGAVTAFTTLTGNGYISAVNHEYQPGINQVVSESQEYKDEGITKFNNILINNSFKLSEKSAIGLLFYRMGTKTTTTVSPAAGLWGRYVLGAPTYSTSLQASTLLTRRESGVFENTNNVSTTGLNLGVKLPMGSTISMAPYGGISVMGSKQENTSDYSFSRTSTADWDSLETEQYEEMLNNGGFGYSAGLRTDVAWKEDLVSSLVLSFAGLSGTVDENYSQSGTAAFTDHINLDSTVLDTLTEWSDQGDRSSISLGLSFITVAELVEDVSFGIGAAVGYTSNTRNYKRSGKTNGLFTFNDGDNQNNDPDDYAAAAATEMSAYVADEITKTSTLLLPVGIEYKFGKDDRWAIRAGAQHALTKQNDTEGQAEHTLMSGTQIVQRDDGTSDTTNLAGAASVMMTDYARGTFAVGSNNITSATQYSCGLGFNPNEHLQIDLLFQLVNGQVLSLGITNAFYAGFVLKI